MNDERFAGREPLPPTRRPGGWLTRAAIDALLWLLAVAVLGAWLALLWVGIRLLAAAVAGGM